MKKSSLVLASMILSAMVFTGCATTSLKEKVTTENMGKLPDTEIGAGTHMQKKFFGGDLVKKEHSVMLYPKKGLAGISFRDSLNKYRLLFDRDGRKAVAAAYEQYLSEFSEKKLDRAAVKKPHVYSSFRSRIEWGSITFTYAADPVADLGYVFVGKSPYFIIDVHNQKGEQVSDDINVEFAGMRFYFTRSQMEDFVNATTEEEIAKVVAELIGGPAETDDYEEADTPDTEDYTETE